MLQGVPSTGPFPRSAFKAVLVRDLLDRVRLTRGAELIALDVVSREEDSLFFSPSVWT